jgi:hypothetical protein
VSQFNLSIWKRARISEYNSANGPVIEQSEKTGQEAGAIASDDTDIEPTRMPAHMTTRSANKAQPKDR